MHRFPSASEPDQSRWHRTPCVADTRYEYRSDASNPHDRLLWNRYNDIAGEAHGRIMQEIMMGKVAAHSERVLDRAGQVLPSFGKKFEPNLTLEKKTELWVAYLEQLLCLSKKKDIDLRECCDLQKELILLINNPDLRAAFLWSMNKMGYLAPVPKIYWRVNRSLETCSDRLRMDLEGFFADLRGMACGPQVTLEEGIGNGACMRDRIIFTGPDDMDVGISNRLYYQVDQFIKRVINWSYLASDGAKLTDAQRDALCRFIYKVIVIQDGKTCEQDIPYDQRTLEELTENPNLLVKIMHRKCTALATTKFVPGDEGVPNPGTNDDMLFPDQEPRPTEPAMERALQLIAKDPDEYLTIGHGKEDAYAKLPIDDLRGLMLGDFTKDLGNIKTKQVNVSLSIRGNVYAEDKDYVDMLLTNAELLDDEGVHVDDSKRLNFGAYYRTAEIKQLAKLLAEREDGLRPPMQIRVIVGPGFEEGENRSEVPITLVMTRSEAKLHAAEKRMYKGCRFLKPEELKTSDEYRTWTKGTAHANRIHHKRNDADRSNRPGFATS